jgi:glutamine synthetase
VLKPVSSYPDPIRGGDDKLVMCEVMLVNGKPHPTNTRAALVRTAKKYKKHEPIFGIEQEYTFFRDGRPLGFPPGGFPAPQGGYYCGVGDDEIHGRLIVEDHMDALLEAGIALSGINAEVMPGQWEFQVGPVGPLEVADQLWVARWLLYRIAENYGVTATLDPKPVPGDWNGAGAHTNFSTIEMREDGGYKYIEAACKSLGKKAEVHIANYGIGVEDRLTGAHETQRHDEFSYGVSDRGASVRIPWQVAVDKKGYLEGRRPNANIDPYVVAKLMIDTICGDMD